MSDIDSSELEPEEVSRRVFIGKVGGTLAGLAGLFGLAKAGSLLDETKDKSGYGGSAYGGEKG